MSLSSRALALLVSSFALAALSTAACGGSVEGTGGGGASTTSSSSSSGTASSSSSSSSGGNADCDGVCTAMLACVVPSECVLVDAAAAEQRCKTNCAAAYAALTAGETTLLNSCIDCMLTAAPGICLFDNPAGEAQCQAPCSAPGLETAGEKWADILMPQSGGGPDFLCTNGKDALGGGVCSGSGGDGTCDIECCNGSCPGAPTVGATCTPDFGDATCTCTAGKNKGKTYTTTDACSDGEVWNQCNL